MRWRSESIKPGTRRRRLTARFKRWATRLAAGDPRFRRIALNYLFANHVARGTLCLVPFDDHEIFANPRDDKISFTLLSGRAWQRKDLEAAFALAASAGRLAAGGVFVDVGANIGAMTLYALLSGRFRHAIAVEPDAENRSILERNLALNDLTDKATVLASAASAAPGRMTLHRDIRNLGAHSLEPGFTMAPGATDDVAVDTLDSLVTAAGFRADDISFVKIDVEGHERAVLAGMPELLAARPVLMMEATFDATDDARAVADMAALMSVVPAGYSTCTSLTQHDLTTGLPVTGPIQNFRPTAMQHELLIH